MSAEDMALATTESVSVLFNLKHDGGVYLSSQWEPVPLKIFLRGKEVKLAPEPKAEAEEKDVLFDEMVVAMPWLQHLDKVQGYQASIATAEETPSSSSGQQPVDIFDMDEESLLSALDRVDRARAAEMTIARSTGILDFVCKECRGESTYRLTGVYHDAVQGNCSTAAADSWARRHNLQVTFKCTFSQHAEGPSRIIVRAWCHRMQCFFRTGGCFRLRLFFFYIRAGGELPGARRAHRPSPYLDEEREPLTSWVASKDPL